MSNDTPSGQHDWTDVYARARRGARADRLQQLLYEIRRPDKPTDYDPQRAAEALADLVEEGGDILK